jgi:phenylalanyl-tRNA synthetase beta chain
MKVPLRWLKEFVDIDLTLKELSHRLTMAGLEAEKIERIGDGWDNVYVGLVRDVSPHPDADRLVLADVEAGEHRLTVVTGAPNIAKGQKVALALAGARLVDAYADEYKLKTLKPGKIRGIESQGMVCSEKELGLSEEHQGILVLEENAPVGAPLVEWLGDTVIEFEITPNRVDAFSVLGIAREVSALTGSPVKPLAVADLGSLPHTSDLVTVANDEIVSRYTAAIIDNVSVEPSPAWMQRQLAAAGIRPISNLVDITNYVMLEIGQPTHAFDLRLFPTSHVTVRPANEGETLVTLDHVERKLTPAMTMIANDEMSVGLGGIIGGENSEITDDTTAILLESATFNMKTTRATSRALKIRTDASARYERGLDPELAAQAQARAIHLILELCPGATVRAYQDVYPNPVTSRVITFDAARIEHLLGIRIPNDAILDTLTRLSFAPTLNVDTNELSVVVPTWRPDVQLREDVIEEVARIVGYDALPATLMTGTNPPIERDPMFLLERDIRRTLVSSGVSEARTYVTVSDKDFHAWAGERRPIRLVNPVNADEANMRTTPLSRLIEAVSENLKHSSSVKLFEIGHIFLARGAADLPQEPSVLGIAVAGQRHSFDRFHPKVDTSDQLDYFDVKGLVDAIAARHPVSGFHFERIEHPMLHPGRSAALYSGETRFGFLGEVRPDRAAELGVDGPRLVVAELNLSLLQEHKQERTGATIAVDRFLPVEQDFAVIVDKQTPAGEVEDVLRAAAGPLATSLMLFDIFEGSQIGEDKKSLAYRITFTAPDRALTDAELGKVRTRIEKVLKQKIRGALRT